MYSIPTPDLKEFGGLTDAARTKIRLRLQLLERAAGLMAGQGLSQAEALQACCKGGGPGLSAKTMKRLWQAYRQADGDWRVLGDARSPSNPNAHGELKLWAQNLVSQHKRKTGSAAAWRAGIRQLVGGDRIPGLGTWKEIWRRENPARPTPDHCPYSELPNCQPKKLSHRNFYRLGKMSKAARAISLTGTAAGRGELANLLTMDTSSIPVLGAIAFDDFRLDFMVECEGKIVELWGLAAMDLATRHVIRFGLRPRRLRADGTHEGITRRDMQHLICGILRQYGYPANYQMMLLVENASAAITEGFEAALREVTGGRVFVQRTPMLGGNPFNQGWSEEKKGNPRAKGWIESAYNLMHNEASAIRGQIGADYSLRSQSHAPAVRYQEKLMRQAHAVLTLTERKLAGLPFANLEEARRDIEEVFHRMNTRQNHSLLGFDLLTEWCPKGMAGGWQPWDELPQGLPKEILQASIQTRRRPESPAERLQRLSKGCKFISIPAVCMPDLLLDHAVVTYKGGDVIGWKKDNQMIRFDLSQLPRLEEGTTLTAWYDADNLEDGAWLSDASGRKLGHAPRTMKVNPLEIASLTEGAKHKAKAFARRSQEISQIHYTADTLDALRDAATHNLAIIDSAESLLPRPAESAAPTEPRRPAKAKPFIIDPALLSQP